MALGYSMVYGIIKLLNFAHGDIYMLGAFAGFAILGATGGVSPDMQLPLLLGVLVVTMGFTGMCGVLLERIAYRRLRSAPRLSLLITAVGAFGVQIPGGVHGFMDPRPFGVLVGVPTPGAGFAWGSVVLIISRIAFWGAALAFMVLIAIGTPRLIERRRAGHGSRDVGQMG